MSGHNHGGQVILPVLGGIYGGDQGWFPKYVDGIHHFKTLKNMIITRGWAAEKKNCRDLITNRSSHYTFREGIER